ncbi:MAG: MBL fold metallo-hydrolase [Bacillota bacterium]|nr:MBL fold metallo-hydrolase [Bacillota bacterium]
MKKYLSFALSTILILCTLCGCESMALNKIIKENFSIDVLNTGKSDCIIICMDGLNIVNDTADADDYDKINGKLKEFGVSKIDYLILSHYDKDHIGSAAKIVEKYRIKNIIGPDRSAKSEEATAFKNAMKKKGYELTPLKKDMTIKTANGEINLNPPSGIYDKDKENNDSLITTVTYKGENFLLTGDAMKERLEEFSEYKKDTYNIVKCPHHGDYTDAFIELITQTKAKAVVITDTKEDTSKKLIEKLTQMGVKPLYTSDGDVHITMNEKGVTFKQK